MSSGFREKKKLPIARGEMHTGSYHFRSERNSMSKAALEALRQQNDADMAELNVLKPRIRSDCEEGPRPCPWVSCRYHLAVDVSHVGSLRLMFPDTDVVDMLETCALDVAENGQLTLEDVALTLNISRERARQIEEEALHRLRNYRDLEDLRGGNDDF